MPRPLNNTELIRGVISWWRSPSQEDHKDSDLVDAWNTPPADYDIWWFWNMTRDGARMTSRAKPRRLDCGQLDVAVRKGVTPARVYVAAETFDSIGCGLSWRSVPPPSKPAVPETTTDDGGPGSHF
ncbi:hypothetical protein B0H19DRAFT_1074096 [Mycena capillaripes]|nr:hypothetical protein B0H19DRAFT_1074096 [Mycena capillaripes]